MVPTLAECLARPRNDLAAVRILAATAVLHAHAWVVTTPGLKTEDMAHVFAFSFDFHGVHAFFILSGMLLARSIIDRPDALRFMVARGTRYLPAIFVSAAFAAFVVGPLTTTLPLGEYLSAKVAAFPVMVTTLADVNATLPGVFEANRHPSILYIPLWTIRYELVFAAILGIAGALGLLRLRALVLAGLIGVLAFSLVWFWNGEEHLYLGWPHHLTRFSTTFGIGIAMGVFADKIPVSNRILLVLAAIAVPLAFTHLAAVAGMLLMAYAILCIGFCGGAVMGFLARLGVWSYGFYVWGFLFEQIIAYALPTSSAWTVLAIAFPLSLVAGWLSWDYIEKPSIARTGAIAAWLRRFVPRRTASAVGQD